jgi:hypothetical protein
MQQASTSKPSLQHALQVQPFEHRGAGRGTRRYYRRELDQSTTKLEAVRCCAEACPMWSTDGSSPMRSRHPDEGGPGSTQSERRPLLGMSASSVCGTMTGRI